MWDYAKRNGMQLTPYLQSNTYHIQLSSDMDQLMIQGTYVCPGIFFNYEFSVFVPFIDFAVFTCSVIKIIKFVEFS